MRRSGGVHDANSCLAAQIINNSAILGKLSARQAILNSAFALSRSRMLNCLNLRTCLIHPFGGSDIYRLLAWQSTPFFTHLRRQRAFGATNVPVLLAWRSSATMILAGCLPRTANTACVR
jgi:hypothetical protein